MFPALDAYRVQVELNGFAVASRTLNVISQEDWNVRRDPTDQLL